MTRSSVGATDLLDRDPEIERTILAARRALRSSQRVATEPNSDPDVDSVETSSSADSGGNPIPPDTMADQENNRTLKQLTAPGANYQPLCIQYPAPGANFELKSGLIHLLPKFHGLAGEDPHKHLKEFHVVCSTMRPQQVDEDLVKLRAFPFSLDGGAKDWLYYLQPSSIASWADMQRVFLERFFPSSRATTIRKEISGIKQLNGETMHEYWERFKRLCASCPHHQITEQLLITYFYEGLLPSDRNLVDASSGGALVNKTPQEARDLISTIAANSQQFGSRSNSGAVFQMNASNDSHQRLENRIDDLTSMVR